MRLINDKGHSQIFLLDILTHFLPAMPLGNTKKKLEDFFQFSIGTI